MEKWIWKMVGPQNTRRGIQGRAGGMVGDYHAKDYHKCILVVKNNYKCFVCCGIAR